MVSLSDDMVTEIILRLPAKSAARSMCVSKGWHGTISDDYVRRRLPPQMSLVYFPDVDPARGKAAGPRFACASGGDGPLEDCDLGFFPHLDGAVACDASNGLLLFRSAAGGEARFYVVDPVARRWVLLPRPPSDPTLSILAFDPSASPAPRYHVVSFTGWRGRVGEVEVFSSETWGWAARDAHLGVFAGALAGAMHLHGGAAYVLAFEPDCIVRMDVAGGGLACATIALPEPTDGDGPVTHSAGLLHYVTNDRDRFNVWALDESSPARQWELKHAVKVDDVVEVGCGRAGEIRFLAMHPDRDVAFLWYPWKVVEYDFTRKEVTGTWEFGDKDHKNRVFKTWLVPSSFYLSDCLPDDGRVQC
jgi:hypothetical protein